MSVSSSWRNKVLMREMETENKVKAKRLTDNRQKYDRKRHELNHLTRARRTEKSFDSVTRRRPEDEERRSLTFGH